MTRREGLVNVEELLNRAIREPASVARLSAPDLDLLIRVSRRVRLLGRLGADLEARDALDSLPLVARDQLESALVYARSRSRIALWELDRIAYALTDGKPTILVALKGCAYLLLDLPSASSRLFADVDLLMTEVELEAVEYRLNQKGWRTKPLSLYDDNYYRCWTHELPPLSHVERQVEVDLHHNLLPRTARLKPPANLLLANAVEVQGSPYRVLAGPDLVLHAMVHLFVSDEMADKLRDLVDISDLMHHFATADPTFWQQLVERAQLLGLMRPAYYGLRYAHRYLDFPLPAEVLRAVQDSGPPAPVRWLMDCLVRNALYPSHPDASASLSRRLSRWLLFLRSHWLRMPPWLLAYHLAYKVLATRLKLFNGRDSRFSTGRAEKSIDAGQASQDCS